MGKLRYSQVSMILLMSFTLALSLISCANAQSDVTISYTFPLIPITFSFDSNGYIGVSAAANFVTELGEISVSAGSAISAFPVPNNSLMLTIRHKENGNLVDTVYQINSGVVGSADIQGNISEVQVAWNGQNNSIFVDASNGDITTIVIQGTASSTTSNVPATVVPTNPPTPVPAFQCPSADQVSGWTSVNVSQISENCGFTVDGHGAHLSGVICTTQDGGTTIEYTPVSQTNTLVIKACDGSQLPDVYGFTIRFVHGYPGGDAGVCSLAQHAKQQLPNWTILPQANC